MKTTAQLTNVDAALFELLTERLAEQLSKDILALGDDANGLSWLAEFRATAEPAREAA